MRVSTFLSVETRLEYIPLRGWSSPNVGDTGDTFLDFQIIVQLCVFLSAIQWMDLSFKTR